MLGEILDAGGKIGEETVSTLFSNAVSFSGQNPFGGQAATIEAPAPRPNRSAGLII